MKTLLLFTLCAGSLFSQTPRSYTTMPTPCGSQGEVALHIVGVKILPNTCQGDGTWKEQATIDQAVVLPLAQTDVTGLPAALTATEKTANKGTVNGYAGLDGTGKVPTSQLPAGTAPATVKYASQLTGASLDVDVTTGLKIGGGSATDNLTAANAFLATASPTNPIIFYIDGPMGIRGALDVQSIPNTTIECIGGGSVYALSGSNSDVIHNGPPVPADPQTTAATRAGTIRIRGCTLYGNRGTFPNGNSSLFTNGSIDVASGNQNAHERGGLGGYQIGTLTGALTAVATSFTLSKPIPMTVSAPFTVLIDSELILVTAFTGANVTAATRGTVGSTVTPFPYGPSNWTGMVGAASHTAGTATGMFSWYCGINLMNLANVQIDNVHVIDSPTYGYRGNNNGPTYITNSQIEFTAGVGQAPNTDGIHISGPASDVHILNSTLTNTGDDAIAFNLDEGYGGTGARLEVDNVTCDRCAVGARIYANATSVKSVVFRGFHGTFRDKYMILGFNVGATPSADAVASLSVSDGDFTSQGAGNTMIHAVELGTNIGTFTMSNMRWVAPNAAANTWFNVTRSGIAISDLRLINSGLYQNTTGSAGPSLIAVNGAAVKKLTTTGYSVAQQSGGAYAAVPYLIDSTGGGTISQWINNNLDPNNISALSSSATLAGITEISGAGLTETGFSIPDAKILKNGQYYVSKESGVPVVKFGSSYATSAAPVLTDTGAHNALLNPSTSITVAARLQATSNTFTEAGTGSFSVFGFINPNPVTTSTQNFVSSMDLTNVTTLTSYWLGYANGPGVFEFVTADNSHAFKVADGTTAPTSGNWYFVVGVHDASTPSARIDKLFVNAVQESGNAAAGASVFNAGMPLGVGGSYSSGAGLSQVLGRSAMVGKVSTALTPTQITYLYNSGFGRTPAEVNAYLTAPAVDFLYSFTNSGALGTDSSTHGTTLTTIGTVSQGTGPH